MATIYDLDEAMAKVAAQGLTLATIRDMVLDERDADRSDDHLVKAIGALVREHRVMKTAVNWDVLREMSKGWQIKYLPQDTKTTGGNDGNH